jgi:hypothetical protein
MTYKAYEAMLSLVACQLSLSQGHHDVAQCGRNTQGR